MLNSFLSITLNIIIFTLVCNSFLKLRISKSKYIIYCIVIVLIKMIPYVLNLYQINFIVTFLLFLLMIIFFYEGSFFSKFFFLVVYAICNILSELLVFKIISLFFSADTVFNINSNAHLLAIILNNCFLLLLAKVFSYYIKAFTLPVLPKHIWLVFILPITTLMLIMGINDYYEVTNGLNYFVFILIGLLLSNLVCIYVFYFAINKIVEENKIRQESNEIKIKLDATKKSIKQYDIFLHNIRKQSTDMLSLLENNKLDELNSYINDRYLESINTYNMIHTNCDTLDMLINDRLYIIKNNKIKINALLENYELNNISSTEFEFLLSYFLDLCISEVLNQNITDKRISISSKVVESMTVLSFSFNSDNTEIKLIKDKINNDLKSSIIKEELNYSVFYNDDIQSIVISILFSN